MKELTLAATLEQIEPATDFVSGQLEEAGCSMKVQMQVAVAMDEIFSNIAHYAYPEGEGTVTVRFETEDRTAVITFIDSGVPYNPLTTEEPDVTQSAEDRKIGGLGIFLVRKTMDDVAYEYRNGQNVLTLRKAF